MMPNKVHSLLWLLFISIVSVNAQSTFKDGYIVSMQNDTTYGQIGYHGNAKNYQSCLFKNSEGEKMYSPDQLLGFGYSDGRYFTSKIEKGEFTEVLVTGVLSLYKSNEIYYLEKDTTIYRLESRLEVVNHNGEQKIRDVSNWKGVISYLLSDCATNNTNTIANLRLDEEVLSRVVVKYNQCTNQAYKEFKSNIPWVKIDYGLKFEQSFSDITLDIKDSQFAYLSDSYSSINPVFGAVFAIKSPRTSDRLAFVTEINYSRAKYYSYAEKLGSINYYYDTYINLNMLSIPLTARLDIPIKKVNLYIQGGLNYDIQKGSSARLESEYSLQGVVNTIATKDAFPFDKFQMGTLFGIGICKPYKKLEARVSARYIMMNPLVELGNLTANNNRISINLNLLKK